MNNSAIWQQRRFYIAHGDEAIGARTGWRSGRSQAEGARGKREKEVLKNKHDMLACLVFIG
jgi:hypothetical protein